jgi:hypothetical protein
MRTFGAAIGFSLIVLFFAAIAVESARAAAATRATAHVAGR